MGNGPTQMQRAMFLLLVLSRAAGLLVEAHTCSQLWIPRVSSEEHAKLRRLPARIIQDGGGVALVGLRPPLLIHVFAET
eukprot:9588815-Alexandrium_andersonii.AAC.1